ncbi:MAG: diaminopimelate epimerase [Steroidobacteraceae bacterium]
MRIEFTKMHGLGNDFVVFDAAAGAQPPSAAELRRLADRHKGIGFDQALMLEPPRRDGTSVYYRIFNADGHEVEQCGNGARCIAALLVQQGRAAAGEVAMDSPGGLVRARVGAGGNVSVDMGVPDFTPASLPFDATSEAHVYPLDVAGSEVEIGAVSMGNPHAVLTVASAAAAPVDRLGPAIERHPRFPKRVNVGFMEIVDRGHIVLRVYERGTGETLACGTGACAAVAVGRRHGRLDERVEVRVAGGELTIDWPGPGTNIWLTGPAEVSFAGSVEIDT